MCLQLSCRRAPPPRSRPQAWLPESPRWLLLSGSGQGAAAAALRRLKGSAAVEAAVVAEIAEIDATMEAAGGGQRQSASFGGFRV